MVLNLHRTLSKHDFKITSESTRIMAAATVTVRIPLDRYQFQIEVDLNDTVETVVTPVKDFLESKKETMRGGLRTLHFTPSNSTRPVLLSHPPAFLERTLQDVGIENGSILIAYYTICGPGLSSTLTEVDNFLDNYNQMSAKE